MTQLKVKFEMGNFWKLLFNFIFVVMLTGASMAQTQFQKTIGGTGSDIAFAVIPTTDGGYAVAGYTNSFGAGNYDFYVVKFNSSGTVQWNKTRGGTGDDEANGIMQTADGGYAVVGSTNSFGAGDYDMYIAKLDASGTLQWNKTVGGTGYDEAVGIIQTADGGYAAAGTTNSFGAGDYDIYVAKLDGSGSLQWTKTIGTAALDGSWQIVQTTDGGYAVGGFYNSKFCIAKLDGSGSLQWCKTIGGLGFGLSLLGTTDGGFALAGYTNAYGAGNCDLYMVKLDSTGSLLWTRTVGGTAYDQAVRLRQTNDGGYILAGNTKSFGAGDYDFYVVKLNGSGALQWSKSVGGSESDQAWDVMQTTDGGYIAVGETQSFGAGGGDMFIVKIDAGGNPCGNSSSPSSSSGTGGTVTTQTSTVTSPTSIVTTPSPLTGAGGNLSALCITGVEPVSNEVPASFELYQNYPNPFNPATSIKYYLPEASFVTLKLFDMLGREVAILVNEHLNPGSHEINWDASAYPSGVYFYKLATPSWEQTKKMILIK